MLSGGRGPGRAWLLPAPGTAGVMVSLSRILTKLLLPDERASTLIFFLVSAGLELLCFLLHLLVRRSRFVLYYTTRPRDSRGGCRAGYRVHHDVAAGDIQFVSLSGAATARSQPTSWPSLGPSFYLQNQVSSPRGTRVCGLRPGWWAGQSRPGGQGALWWQQGLTAPEGAGWQVGRHRMTREGRAGGVSIPAPGRPHAPHRPPKRSPCRQGPEGQPGSV